MKKIMMMTAVLNTGQKDMTAMEVKGFTADTMMMKKVVEGSQAAAAL